MTYSNLTVTSIPIFIKEYLLHDTDNQLKSISKEALDILSSLSFETTKRGYRDIIYTTIPDIDGYRFTLDLFFSFALSKTSRLNELQSPLYSRELNIPDDISSEVFEAIVIDNYGDKILYSLILDEYDKGSHSLSFMLL